MSTTTPISGKPNVKNGGSDSLLSIHSLAKIFEGLIGDENISSQLSKLILDHRTMLVDVERRNRCRGYFHLGHLLADEAALRDAIIQWRPLNRAEAMCKLAYLGSFIIATGLGLDDDELDLITASVEPYKRG